MFIAMLQQNLTMITDLLFRLGEGENILFGKCDFTKQNCYSRGVRQERTEK